MSMTQLIGGAVLTGTLVIAASAQAAAITEPFYQNYPLEQRQKSAAPAYLPDQGLPASAGSMRGPSFEPGYRNYYRQANGGEPYRHQYQGDYVPRY
ncbi:hypothetical protein [Marinobacterium arenosum]|uniref:hypothetical protein n=1 Tax=Marinobacterium arenosum TaxID=2862496 RepID=UPI001C976D82|nr:hypothetical protein [Marinobacterium arenosum]MBY4677225.1 hypothetical protein [Marinobacterium arenosum]